MHGAAERERRPASPARIASALGTGSAPGRPRQAGQTFVLGGSPKVVRQPQNILVRVRSCTCTSSPITVSQATSAPRSRRAPRARSSRRRRGGARPRTTAATSCAPTGSPSLRPTGRLSAGQPGEAHGAHEDVGEVHRDRIVGLLARLEGRRGRRGREQEVHAAAERASEVVGDEGAHPLCLAIVGVVVAGAQHVGADENPALNLRAEALAAGGR